MVAENRVHHAMLCHDQPLGTIAPRRSAAVHVVACGLVMRPMTCTATPLTTSPGTRADITSTDMAAADAAAANALRCDA
eukprot:202290-Chlamydomonas_euryale.AAC.2